MKLRTTDPHVETATNKFFEDLALEQSALEYFNSANVKEKISEGYSKYKQLFDEATKSAPEGAEDLVKEVAEKFAITEETYEENVFEIFKENITDIFQAAAIYIDIKSQIVTLFQNYESEDLLLLAMNSMDEFIEEVVSRLSNFLILRLEGIPMEEAEKMVDEVEDAEILPFTVEIECCDEDDSDDEPEGEDNHCCCEGECGANCKCGESEHEGHCQCECDCKCGDHADE